MPLRAPAWRLTAALLLLLAAVVTVVLWRAPSYSGAGEVLLRVAAGVAVVGLLVAGWLAARVATAAPTVGRELEIPLVPLDAPPPTPAPATPVASEGSRAIATTSSDAAGNGGRWGELRRAVGVAAGSLAPVLLVLVLVPTGRTSGQQQSTVSLTLGTPQPTAGTTGTSSAAGSPGSTGGAPGTPPPSPPTPPTTTPPPPTPAGCATPYAVRPGDTLWRIAARRLPAGATGPQVDRLWRRVYALNRGPVGADPGRLRIGQRLRLPC